MILRLKRYGLAEAGSHLYRVGTAPLPGVNNAPQPVAAFVPRMSAVEV